MIKSAQQVRLKPELWQEIDNQAIIEERSRNKMVELLIKRGLEWTRSRNLKMVIDSDFLCNSSKHQKTKL